MSWEYERYWRDISIESSTWTLALVNSKIDI